MLEHVVFEWRDALDILLVAFLLYQVIQLLRGSRALTVLTGLGLLTLLYFISRSMALYTLTWLLQHVFSSLFLLIVVIFQSDIRQALGEIGTNNLFRKRALQHSAVEEVVMACVEMARLRVGALIVIKRDMPLTFYEHTGDIINADVNPRLIENIFFKNSPLHDGAMIIADNRIRAAGCILPVSHNLDIPKSLGLRHRAALGISQETDAIAVVVSEETGNISVAMNGKFKLRLSTKELEQVLTTA